MSRKKVTNMSEILKKETQTFREIAKGGEPEQLEKQSSAPEPTTTTETPTVSTPKEKNNNATLLENNNVAKTKKRMTDERDTKMYYFNPGQTDKLDDLKREYKKRTGKKLNDQDFMRHIVDCLTIDMLL
jgi:hypothetical protein